MDDAEYTVALWYMRYGAPDYELHETEEDAASYAVSLEDNGNGSVMGVQFSDGRLVRRRDWDVYKAEILRRDEAEERQRAVYAAQPPRPTREIRDPFEHRPFKVEADEPAWLGEAAASNPR